MPAPVARYLGRVLGPGQPEIRAARFRQAGTLRTGAGKRWMRFEAVQTVRPPVHEFEWDARVHLAPFLHLRVRDALIAGRGSGRVDLLSAIRLAEDAGSAEMSSGALHRYLAEAVWYPTALLPSRDLRWSTLGEGNALATLANGATSVSLEFRFAATGEVTAIHTPARWGRFAGVYRQAGWEGHFFDYRQRNGMLVPTEGEIGWHDARGWQAVWKGRVTEASYETGG